MRQKTCENKESIKKDNKITTKKAFKMRLKIGYRKKPKKGDKT